VLRRSLVLVAALAAALVLAASALAAGVTVRVEGKTQTIFGSVPAKIDADNALQALDLASTLGEFYYQLTHSSFGVYVSQIGKYPAAGSAGWVFKVNGASPPVGADQVELKDGDTVLWYWAEFGPNGGPPTLEVKADGRNCYRVTSYDDAGKATAASMAVLHVDGRRIKTPLGRGCVGVHHGLVRAYAVGAVRSNSVK
jgi:Domain of unknown function (DUF4430)